MQPPFEVIPIIKTVGVACNLKCSYCWFNPLDQSTVRRMPEALLERLIQGLVQVNSTGRFQFIWHGGEPLLAGRPFFESALQLQERHITSGEVKNVIQTNGTLLDEKWVDFFLNNDFKVGISLDGPARHHDYYRKTIRGGGSHASVLENLKNARKAGLKISVIATINQNNVDHPDELFDFFVDNKIFSIGFNMVLEHDEHGNVQPFSVSQRQYADFQKRIFDRWLALDNSKFRIRHVDNALAGLLGMPVKSCIYAGTCKKFINVNSNGDVYPCERLTTAPRLGDLNTSSLQEILQGEAYAEHSCSSSQLPDSCKRCSFLTACYNGCTHHRVGGKLAFCEARKEVFRHIEKQLGLVRGNSLTQIPVRSS